MIHRCRITFTGLPGVVVPHGARMRAADGVYELRWAPWRRAAVFLGLSCLALTIGRNGKLSIVVDKVKE